MYCIYVLDDNHKPKYLQKIYRGIPTWTDNEEESREYTTTQSAHRVIDMISPKVPYSYFYVQLKGVRVSKYDW